MKKPGSGSKIALYTGTAVAGAAGVGAAVLALPLIGAAIAVMIPLAVGMLGYAYFRVLKPALEQARLLQTGRDGSGRVMSLGQTNATVNGHPVLAFTVRVSDAAGDYDVKFNQPIPRQAVHMVTPNSAVPLKIDTANRRHVAIDTMRL